MKSAKQNFLLHLIIVLLIIGVVSIMWDGWWHLAVGRDSFLIPPHILLYSSVGLAVLAGFYGWFKFRQKVWRNVALILLIIPAIAPIDNFWHSIFGVEDFSSAWVIWSPPHVVGILATITVLVTLLKILSKEKNLISVRFFGGLILAAILSFLYLLVAPIYPTGPYHILGFWGAGIISFFIIGLLLLAHKWLPGVGGAVDVTLYGIGIMVAGPLFGEQLAKGVIIPPHSNPPNWILAFGFLVPAILIDLFGKYPKWIIGGSAGGIYALLLYGLASQFLTWNFRFPLESVSVAVFSATIGGIIAGLVILRAPR